MEKNAINIKMYFFDSGLLKTKLKSLAPSAEKQLEASLQNESQSRKKSDTKPGNRLEE